MTGHSMSYGRNGLLTTILLLAENGTEAYRSLPDTLLYIRMGTFITLLLLDGPAPGAETPDPARQTPRMNWYENFSARPRNVGGRFSGRTSVYVSKIEV